MEACLKPDCGSRVPSRGRTYCSNACSYADRARLRVERQPIHVCNYCGAEFRWNGRGRGAYCSLPCGRRHGKELREPRRTVEAGVRPARQEDWVAPPLTPCVACGSHGPLQRHHVIYRQHVIREGGAVHDPRNQMILCSTCHSRHHAGSSRIARCLVPDAAREFAAELMGEGAGAGYLERRYAG